MFTVLFTFPSQYWFTIGLSGVFSLTGWCRQIQTGRLQPRPTQDTTSPLRLPLRGYHPLWPAFPCRSINPLITSLPQKTSPVLQPTPPSMICGPATPGSPCESPGLGYSDFARHYFRNHGCFLFLGVLRWFTSPRSLPSAMYSRMDTWCSHQVGSPIRISPDHRMLASPRGVSPLATSFFAC